MLFYFCRMIKRALKMQNIHEETQRIIKCRSRCCCRLMLLKQKALAKICLLPLTHNRQRRKNSRHFISGSNNNIRAHRRGKCSQKNEEDLIKKFPRLIKIIDQERWIKRLHEQTTVL